MVLSGLVFVLFAWLLYLHLLYPEPHSTKFYDVTEGHVESVGLTGVKVVRSISNYLPCHMNMVFVRIFLDGLIVKQPICILFVH